MLSAVSFLLPPLVELRQAYWVRKVKAALVMDEGRLRPLVISLQIFLLMTSTKPPLWVTSLYSSYRSKVCLAMMGIRLTGVPKGDSFFVSFTVCAEYSNLRGNWLFCRVMKVEQSGVLVRRQVMDVVGYDYEAGQYMMSVNIWICEFS